MDGLYRESMDRMHRWDHRYERRQMPDAAALPDLMDLREVLARLQMNEEATHA